MRARKAAFGGYSLLLCAGLAFIFVAPEENRNSGVSSSPSLDVSPAQAMVPSARRPIALPSDRVMNASIEVLGRLQAADVWSTPLDLDELNVDETASASQHEARAPAAAEPIPDGPQGNLDAQTGVIERPVATQRAVASQDAIATERVPAPSTRSTTAVPPSLSFRSIAGKWAAHRAACSERSRNRTAHLPLTIDQRGARAGGASCSFRRTEQNGNRWSVAATCTSDTESWTANVRLVLAGNKLTWSSERGAQTYTRCP